MAQRILNPKGLAQEIGKSRPFNCLETETYLNLVRTHGHFAAACARFFRCHGITSPQYNVLRILRGHNERMRTHQVADEMVTREPDITRLIDRLVESGLVARYRCPDDRRVVWVELSKAGIELLGGLDDPVEVLHKSMLGHLDERKLRQLNRLLFEARHTELGA